MGRNKKDQEKEKNHAAPRSMPKLGLSSETKRGIAVVLFVVLSIISFLSVLTLAGNLGDFILRIYKWVGGLLGYFTPVLFFVIAVVLARQQLPEGKDDSFYWRVYLGVFLFCGSVAGLLHVFYMQNGGTALNIAMDGRGGGYTGALFSLPATPGVLGFFGGSVFLFALLVISVLILFNVSLNIFFPWKKKDVLSVPAIAEKGNPKVQVNGMAEAGFVNDKLIQKNEKVKLPEEQKVPDVVVPQKTATQDITIKTAGTNGDLHLESITLEARKDWKLPPFDLLEDNHAQVDSGNIELNVSIIKKTLQDFGIEVEMGEVNVGPTVTQYTLRPATGVKLSQIAALQNDLALSLAAHSIRMELPIPGKALVGLEVPNRSSAIVRLREVMQTASFVDHKSKLALSLGRDVAGHPQVTDLAKMPHLLIAGATGTGKSVCINSLFISLLYRNTPQDVKFIVIDPKRVELNLYNGIPHLLTPVITDHEKAVNALKWAVAEMDRRYKLLSEAGKRNIIEYNEASELTMPYIVIIVDELADLMAVSQNEVEAAIVRLAQMARAIGIHLVVATQRPSVDIITGLIKANITSRIAFAVASQIDSRTILDSSGAEKLLGNGDMLFTSAEFNKPKRIQGAYIGEKEVKKVVDFFKEQTGAVIYNDDVIEKPKRNLGVPGFEDAGTDDSDPMLEEAVEEVRRAGKASASLLQRRLRVGYARAARLLDILEEKGIIGPGEGAKPREVFGVIPPEERAEYGVEGPVQENEE
jgi:S-DNA-T family DNA segregation ATPase FtsK/SpoIIIE